MVGPRERGASEQRRTGAKATLREAPAKTRPIGISPEKPHLEQRDPRL